MKLQNRGSPPKQAPTTPQVQDIVVSKLKRRDAHITALLPLVR